MSFLENNYFNALSDATFKKLAKGELLTLSLQAEDTLFARVNGSKIRQASHVKQGDLSISYFLGKKTIDSSMSLSGELNSDILLVKSEIESCRKIAQGLPDDPYIVLPENLGTSNFEVLPSLPTDDEIIGFTLDHVGNCDLAGVITKGELVRANANSLGQAHWFKTRNFYVDYSLYNHKQNAVKSLYAGHTWDQKAFQLNLQNSVDKLKLMDIETKKIPRGEYMTYLEPAAVNEILGMLNWNGLSTGAHKKGNGCFKDFFEGKKKLSPLFTLTEDFNLGLRNRFNELGELADIQMPIISKGELKNFFTSTRTAKEFNIPSNKAAGFEGMRSPIIETGDLKREDILKKIGIGLYLSNLHYLNWSDRESSRITGMTRYACFWVENGKIVAPIKDLRFDETLFQILGEGLLAITDFSEIIPATGSYGGRDVGGSKVPGMLIKNFKFTL
jgi:predicted Zn-dependent protease